MRESPVAANGLSAPKTVNLNALFERMSQAEMEAYAKDGVLPGWFTETLGATAGR
ncbi:MAG: hypothetical protein ABSD98_18315 [Candidatus Korobacteraceae bacterium]